MIFEFTGFDESPVDDAAVETYEWNGWLGTKGSFKVSFTGLDTESPTATMSNIVPCIEVDPTIGPVKTTATSGDWKSPAQNCMTITVYTPLELDGVNIWKGLPPGEEEPEDPPPPPEDPSEDDDAGDDAGDDAAPEPEPEILALNATFKVKMKIQKFSLYFASTSDYVAGSYLWNRASNKLERIVRLTDFNGYPVGGFNYAYMRFPLGISSAANFDELDAGDHRQIYFTITNSTNTVTSEGKHCPSTLRVLQVGDSFKNNGDIYDRYYVTEKLTYANHAEIAAARFATADTITLDKASLLKSIRATPTNTAYLKLINKVTGGVPSETVVNDCVPTSMREQILNLVFKQLRLKDDYFTMMLMQLQTFLELIDKQLKLNQDAGTWNSNDIRRLCKFKYDAQVSFTSHTKSNEAWSTEPGGLFGYRAGTTAQTYDRCKTTWNQHLRNEFNTDFATLEDGTVNLNSRDYRYILLPFTTTGGVTGLKQIVESLAASYSSYGVTAPTIANNNKVDAIFKLKWTVLDILYKLLNDTSNPDHDLIHEIFHNTKPEYDYTDEVRYMNAVKTSIVGDIKDMFITDGFCNLFSKTATNKMQWHRFPADASNMNVLIDNKRACSGQYTYDPPLQMKEFSIYPYTNSSDWIFRMANRDLSTTRMNDISDAYIIRFKQTLTGTNFLELWYLSEIDKYIYVPAPLKIVDMAYEQNGDSVYVLFSEIDSSNHETFDPFLYRYDHLAQQEDSQKRVLLKKENATMKIETKHSVYITDKTMSHKFIYIDYGVPETSEKRVPEDWRLNLYGAITGTSSTENDRETWNASPGVSPTHFKQYNTILFGDSLFNEDQLRFQNVSKNKEMFDILDVDEVDGCYYGLFKDESASTASLELGVETYTVFKTARDGGVVQRLPYIVANPNLYRTADPLYSLFVLVFHRDNDNENYRLRLQEISVPDSTVYAGRVIEL